MPSLVDSGVRPRDIHVDSIETTIVKTEQQLGLHSPAERALEATLVIDKPFFDFALITGRPPKPERLFGDKEWAGYLNGRRVAKVYAAKPLTIDFITSVHKELLTYTHPGVTESITDSADSRGGNLVGRVFLPTTLSAQQRTAIENNPFLSWRPADKMSPHSGYISYSAKTRKEKLIRLQEICDWYNDERNQRNLKPYVLAAKLQHRIISLHPLSGDYNGRVSRILMNWSLENDGLASSALSDFEADIYTHEDAWAKAVEAGSERYTSAKKHLLDDSETSLIQMFDLTEESQSYKRHRSHLYTPLLEPGEPHDQGKAGAAGLFLLRLKTLMEYEGTPYGCCARRPIPQDKP